MAQMIRKQIYIKKQHDTVLKRLARARGVSEAEIIRQAIEQQAINPTALRYRTDPAAWERARQFILELRALGPLETPSRKWTRDELYEERMSKYDRHSH